MHLYLINYVFFFFSIQGLWKTSLSGYDFVIIIIIIIIFLFVGGKIGSFGLWMPKKTNLIIQF